MDRNNSARQSRSKKTPMVSTFKGDNLFVPIAAKWLASETDDGGGDDDDPMQIHGDRLLTISI